MPEIAFVIPSFNAGGAERALLNWLRHWPRHQALRPIVVVRRRSGPLLDQVPADISVIDLKIGGIGTWHSAVSTIRLARVIARRKPAVIVALLSLPSIAFATRLADRRTKLIASLQNPMTGSETGFVPNQRRPPWVPMVSHWALRLCDQFWAIAPGIAREAVDAARVPAARAMLLPNSVDIDLIGSKKLQDVDHPAFADPSVPVVVTACRLAWQKRVDVLLGAFAKVCQNRAANLVILGNGPLRGDLEAAAVALGVSDRTYFMGVHRNPWRFIAKASVFALASDFEGLGNVLIEAMACGTPVVATRAWPGPEFIITHESNGLLVPVGDPSALAAGIQRLLTDINLRETCIANGLRRASEFDVSKIIAQVNTCLSTLLGYETLGDTTP